MVIRSVEEGLRINPQPPNPFVTEKKLNEYFEQINNFLKTDKPIPSSLYDSMKEEFEKVKNIYEQSNTTLNLYHISHNFYSRTAMFFLEKNYEIAFHNFITALQFLLARMKIRTYSEGSLDIMSRYYHSLCIRLAEKDSKKLVFRESHIDQFSKMYNHIRDIGNNLDGRFYVIFDSILGIYLHKTYKHVVGKTVYEEEDLDILNSVEKHLLLLKDLALNFPEKMTYNLGLIFNLLYRNYKFKLYFYLNNYEQSGNENYLTSVNDLTRALRSSSQEAKRVYEKLLSITSTPNQKKILEERLVGTIIDTLYSDYLHSLYVTFDFFSALRHIDKLHTYLVNIVFVEKKHINKSQLDYFSSEMLMLKSFLKIILIEFELVKLARDSNQKKIKNIASGVLDKIRQSRLIFKYKHDEKLTNYQLQIITRTFSGQISEYLVHELLLDMTNLKIKGEVDKKIKPLLEKTTDTSHDKIMRNHRLNKKEKDCPDIDVYYDLSKDPLAVFIKNAKISRNEKRKIYKELDYVNQKGVKKIYYCINMLSNMQELNDIKDFFNILNSKFSSLDITVLDLKSLFNEILIQFNRNGFKKFNFSDIDLFRFIN